MSALIISSEIRLQRREQWKYRKLKRMPAKEEAKIVKQTCEYLSRYLELEVR
jgi:hypothetical protein